MYFYALMCFLLPLHVSASTMAAEVYKEGYRVKSDYIISSITVASRIQCLHRCKRINDCQGMNVKISQKNPTKCELTSTVVSQENEEKLLVKDPSWEFYKILKLVRYTVKVVSNGWTTSGHVGPSLIEVNGKQEKTNTHKLIILAFDYEKGFSSKLVHHIDDIQDQNSIAVIKKKLGEIEDGMITMVAVYETALDNDVSAVGSRIADAFAKIGATKLGEIKPRSPYCLIAMKGHSVAWKEEVLGTGADQSVVCEAKIY